MRELGAASTVLLKNEGALPLGKHEGKEAERSIVLIGSDAGPGRMGPNEFSDQGGAITGTLAMGWGSGTSNFTYLVNVSLCSLKQQKGALKELPWTSPSKRSNKEQGSSERASLGY